MKRLLPAFAVLAFLAGLALLYFGSDMASTPDSGTPGDQGSTSQTAKPEDTRSNPVPRDGRGLDSTETGRPLSRPTPRAEVPFEPPTIPTKLENGAAETILRGCVLTPSGNPLKGALISLLRSSDDGIGANGQRVRVKDTVATDGKGCFRFEGLKGGKGYVVIVEAGEYAESETAGVEAPERVETVLPDLRVVAGVDIRGTVRNAEKAAVPRATVALFSLLALHHRDTPIKQVLTRDDGGYEFKNIAPGSYQVTVGAAGYRNDRSKNIAIDLGKPPQLIDFMLVKGHSVTGRVVGVDGKPIDGVVVEGRAKGATSGVTARVTTAADGLFDLAGLGEEDLRIEARKNGYTRAIRDPIVPAKCGFLEIRLSENAGISGTVVDATTKTPIKTFGLILIRCGKNDTPNDPIGGLRPFDFSADGTFTIDDVGPGRYVLQGFAEGFGPTMTRPFDVKRLYVQGVTIEMLKGGKLRGVVLGANGSPLAGATIRMFRNEYVKSPISKMLYGEYAELKKPVRSDESGKFEFTDLGPSSVQLRVTAPEHIETLVKDLACDSGRELDVGAIQLGRGGDITGHVIEAGGTPARNARVLLMGKNGESQETKTSSDGSYAFRNLAPAEYVVSATKAATQGAPENPLTSALASQKSMKTATVVEGGAIAVDIILAELK